MVMKQQKEQMAICHKTVVVSNKDSISSAMNRRGDEKHDADRMFNDQRTNELNVYSCNASEYSSGSEESTNIGSIHIQVNVVGRKEASVDTNYENYLEDFDTEKYALQMDADEKVEYYRSMNMDDHSIGTSLSQKELSDDQILSIGGDMRDMPFEDDLNSIHTTGADCWYGYGSNMYFQPMTCKTLPRLRVRSVVRKPQMLTFTKRDDSIKVMTKSSPMFVRLDTPARRKLLDDLGTLKLAEDTMTSKRSIADRPRVGNFVMPLDLKTKVCKGVVCRTTEDSISSRETVSYREFPSSDFVACIKADLIPTQSYSKKKVHGRKVMSAIGSYGKGVNASRSKESQDLFNCLPRLGHASSFIDKTPKKKIVAGKPLYLSNSLRSVNKLNLFPFCQPTVYIEKSRKRFPSTKQALNCSPTSDEEEIIVNHLEETFVTDNVQKINECEQIGPKSNNEISHEEQYAYDSLFSFYSDKLNDGAIRSGTLKKAIVTKSLVSSLQSPRDQVTKRPNFQIGWNCKAEKNDKPNGARDKHKGSHTAQHISETGLSLSGKSSLPYDMQKYETPPLRREIRCFDHCDNLLFPMVDEKVLTKHDQGNIISTGVMGDFCSPAPIDNYASKTVHFDDEERRILFDNGTSTEPFVATALKPVDRYNISSSNACRLPVIGQKIPPSIS